MTEAATHDLTNMSTCSCGWADDDAEALANHLITAKFIAPRFPPHVVEFEGDLVHHDQAVAILWEVQQGRCATCGTPEDVAGRLVVDHDHDSGLIRALLCPSCNSREGFGGAEWDHYRRRPPARRLGISSRYRHNGAIEPLDRNEWIAVLNHRSALTEAAS